MQRFTNTPIIIAVYENLNDRTVDENIYMFSIDWLMDCKEIEVHERSGIGKCYRIQSKSITARPTTIPSLKHTCFFIHLPQKKHESV
jgi:hypothetical protein